MEVSSTSINVASITASAINQGFTVGALCVVCAGVIPSHFRGENRVAFKDALGVLEVEENFCRAQIAEAGSSSFLKGHGFKPCRHARKQIAALATEGLHCLLLPPRQGQLHFPNEQSAQPP